ncbi:phage scaffolding protein [Clostridium butyricum]|uniref:phage scaffolding protein n=1 Tax=Clostridium butyricum TaxID=1492 RepID=UPI000405462D|nr:phage scaffolding protein [Clostridium butyricum]MDU1340230.1 phage scaffolding protein [Clostridium butyricum]DAV13364.1 MAG TPA: minor structural protein [Caudoviricetes sp.]
MPNLSEILGDAYKNIPEDVQKKYKDIDLVDSSKYIEKSDYETIKKERDQYKKDIKKRDKDLEDIQDKVKDNEELTKEIENLKAENKKIAAESKAELDKLTFESKLEKKLGSYNPQNASMLKKALDLSKITRDGDNFIGLEEQINSLKESDKYLFKEEVVKGKEDNSGGTGSIGTDNTGTDDGTNANSIGALLAKSKAENANAEAQSKFFA